MTAIDEVDQPNEQYHLAAGEFLKGNPEPVKMLYSHREDVSLANPYGPPARGWDEVTKTIEHASSSARWRWMLVAFRWVPLPPLPKQPRLAASGPHPGGGDGDARRSAG